MEENKMTYHPILASIGLATEKHKPRPEFSSGFYIFDINNEEEYGIIIYNNHDTRSILVRIFIGELFMGSFIIPHNNDIFVEHSIFDEYKFKALRTGNETPIKNSVLLSLIKIEVELELTEKDVELHKNINKFITLNKVITKTVEPYSYDNEGFDVPDGPDGAKSSIGKTVKSKNKSSIRYKFAKSIKTFPYSEIFYFMLNIID